jgi:hypothetical protein
MLMEDRNGSKDEAHLREERWKLSISFGRSALKMKEVVRSTYNN